MSHPTRPLFRARWLLMGALAMHAAMAALYAYRSPEPAFDFDRYYEIGSAASRPDVDQRAEHPIAAVAVLRVLAHLPGGRTGFGLGVVGLNLMGDAIIVGALLWGWGEVAAAAFALMVIPVIDLFFNRIDPWSVAAATLAVAAWRREAPRLAGIALAVGVGFKLWPLMLAGILLASPRRAAGDAARVRHSALASFVLTVGALAACALLLAGWRGVLQVVTFRGARGWQIESLVGSLIHLAGAAPWFESGAWRIGSSSGPVSIAMFVAAAPLSAWSGWRGARGGRVGAGWLAAVTVLLLLSALLSAQYVIWLAPAAAIAWTEGDRVSSLLTALAIFLTAVFWASFPAVLAGATAARALVVARNTVLLALAVSALARVVTSRDERDVAR